eukprot:CAMPEP_0183730882 /NCGR_PEP_ID=MMETSP0737-20130205/33763_1 /TAXON_ID=385413 /ORGANISM="Thalassiosira miniscula, Strain CCMP1093" /LENGTH=517 /DNA_ID=CAMNT_0025963473 /DNA_START=62 /DNA_END=1612 /DNA_ORIENTATION=+
MKPTPPSKAMRFLLALFVIVALSIGTVSGVHAHAADADETQQSCVATEHAGECTHRPDEQIAEGHGDDDEGIDEGHENEVEAEEFTKCVDEDEHCATYAQDGACADNPAYMTYRCAASCNTCDVLEEAEKKAELMNRKPCMDDDLRCLEKAGRGDCEANPGYMKQSCRRSCLVCLEGNNQFGIEQRMPPENEVGPSTHEDIVAYMDSTMKYMKTIWSDERFERVRHKCKNQHEDCTYWAAIGRCDSNPSYMRTNCAPACETCSLMDVRIRCQIEPGNISIWGPGDLNALMETIVDDGDVSGDYSEYNPRALSRPKIKRDGTSAPGVEKDGPWVVYLENFVQEEEADRLVELGKERGYEHSIEVGEEKPDGSYHSLETKSRTSRNTWCQDPSCYGDPLVAPVIERIANLTKTEDKNSEYLQLLQYETGQFYTQHHDYIPHQREMPCGVRILTLFIYLNDVEEGGGTHFPLLGITIQPKKGSAVLWPNVLDQDPETQDPRSDHEALPVLKGNKYGANAW